MACAYVLQVNCVYVTRSDFGQQAQVKPQLVVGYGSCWRPAIRVKPATVLRFLSADGQDSALFGWFLSCD